MGAVCCKPEGEAEDPTFGSARIKSWKRQKWRSDEPLTAEQLQSMREEFWDTSPAYGGDRVIWDALRAACEADLETARTILDSAGVIVAAHDMTICYDERGRRYELPRYVISAPSNLAHDGPAKGRTSSSGGRGAQAEQPATAGGAGERSPPENAAGGSNGASEPAAVQSGADG